MPGLLRDDDISHKTLFESTTPSIHLTLTYIFSLCNVFLALCLIEYKGVERWISMLIKWLGHSCFKLEESEESLVFDPFADGSVRGYRDIREEANVCLCSHMHGDHNAAKNVKLVESERDVFQLELIRTYHDDKKGALRGDNTIHIVTVEGYRVAHLGDLGCELTDEQYYQLRDLDVLMIPVGGYFTISGRKAAAIAKRIAPKVIIPMHYRTENYGYEVLSTVDEFTKYFDKVTYLTTDTLNFTDELDGEVVVFDYPEVH